MSRARFNVVGALDSAGGPKRGSVMIDRETGIVEVRVLRKRRVYRVTLGDVATMICQRLLRAEARDRARARKKKKTPSRRRRRAGGARWETKA